MTCLKACPHRSVEVNLRPPGIELWTTHTPRTDEVALLFLLLGGVFLHRLPEIQIWLGLNFDLNQFFTHFLLSILALIVPVLLPIFAYLMTKLWCWWNNPHKSANLPYIKSRSWQELAYGYLPLVLGGNIAHYWRLGLAEGGKIIPVTLATFGLQSSHLPMVVAHPAIIAFLEGITLIFAAFLSIILTQKIARQPIRILIWQHLAIVGLAAGMWAIIV